MQKNMPCSDSYCKGKILSNATVYLKNGCGLSKIATHPCSVCHMLHRDDGTAVLNKGEGGSKAYLKDRKVFVRDEKGVETDITEFVC